MAGTSKKLCELRAPGASLADRRQDLIETSLSVRARWREELGSSAQSDDEDDHTRPKPDTNLFMYCLHVLSFLTLANPWVLPATFVFCRKGHTTLTVQSLTRLETAAKRDTHLGGTEATEAHRGHHILF